MAIDETDKAILSLLLDNAKLSLREIASTVSISAVTALKRIKKLEKNRVIKRYTTLLDYEQIGYDVPVIIKLRISKGKLFEVEKKIATHPNVSAVYDITGDFDAIIIAKFATRRSLDAFIKKIQTYDFIERTETSFILNVIKEEAVRV